MNYRCTRCTCRARTVLRKPIEQYVREPRCRFCGGRLSHDPEVRRRSKRLKCLCDGYNFPHRIGTEPWCKHAKVGPSDEQLEARHYEMISW